MKNDSKYQTNEGCLGIKSNRSVELLTNNVGIQKLVITFIVLSFDMGRLGRKKNQKNERETHIIWCDLHNVVIAFNLRFWVLGLRFSYKSS